MDLSSRQCETCQRVYHVDCLRVHLKSRSIGKNGPVPYRCNECIEQGYASDSSSLPEDIKLYKVCWKPSAETFEMVETVGTTQAKAQLAALQEGRMTQTTKPSCKRQKTAHRMELCSTYHCLPQDRVYDVTVGQAIRRKLIIHTNPINPHADIAPTGRFEVFVRSISYCSGEDILEREMACVYTPDGHCRYMLTPQKAAHLQRGYLHMQHHHPELSARLKAGTFAEEVYKCMLRYAETNRLPTEADTAIRADDQRALPEALHRTLSVLTRCTQERFASPLNASVDMEQYWTPFKEDQIFGAGHNAYSVKWTGSSLAVPDCLDRNSTSPPARPHTTTPACTQRHNRVGRAERREAGLKLALMFSSLHRSWPHGRAGL